MKNKTKKILKEDKLPIFEDQLTKEQLWKEIKKGFNGKTISADKAFKEIEKEFNL